MKTLLLIAEGEKVFMDACSSRVFISIPGDSLRAFPARPAAANHVASTIENSGPSLLSGSVDENAEEFSIEVFETRVSDSSILKKMRRRYKQAAERDFCFKFVCSRPKNLRLISKIIIHR